MPLGLGVNGTALPEEERTAQIEQAARNGYSSGLGLAEASAAAPPQASPQAAPQAAPGAPPTDPLAGPAPVGGAPQGIQKAEPLIDFKKNPLGAIGLVLSSFAAGFEGRESPVSQLQDARTKQDAAAKKGELDALAAQFQRAELGTKLFDAAYKFGLQDPANVDDFLSHYSNIPGMEGIGTAVKNALTAKVDMMDQRLAVIRQTQSPRLAEIAASLLESNDIEFFEKFTGALLDAERRVAEAAETTAATTGARIRAEDIGGRGPEAEAEARARGTKKGAPDKTPEQLAKDAFATAAGTAAGKASVEGTDKTASVEQGNKLRNEYVRGAQGFSITQDAITRLRTAAKRKSGAGDIAIVYNYMKMLEPTSAVLPGEYATVENSGGVPDAIRGLYNKVLTGEFLTDGRRADIVKTAEDFYVESKKKHGRYTKEYQRLAKESGADPSQVVVDFGGAEDEGAGQTDYDKDGNPIRK